MKARFAGFGASANRVNAALALGVFLALLATGSASAALATPEQKKACTPDVYRLLRRQKASLSDACRAVFEP